MQVLTIVKNRNNSNKYIKRARRAGARASTFLTARLLFWSAARARNLNARARDARAPIFWRASPP